MNPLPGNRHLARTDAGIDADALVVLQPTRALPRKNIPGGLALAKSLGATYWLTAAAEDGYGPTLDELLQSARVRVVRGQGRGTIDDVYAASDVVVLPSHWEGFGNPVIESVTHRKPLALGSYPVASELLAFGFEFFSPLQPQPLRDFLAQPDEDLLEENLGIARSHFDIADLPSVLDDLFASSALRI
jgi:glycosyltransferase involved in cell wall biosynthesis